MIMGRHYFYIKIPAINSVLRLQEGCCYLKVVYAGQEIGVIEKMDKAGEDIGPWICMCDPRVEILQISEQEFCAVLNDVNRRREESGKQQN